MQAGSLVSLFALADVVYVAYTQCEHTNTHTHADAGNNDNS